MRRVLAGLRGGGIVKFQFLIGSMRREKSKEMDMLQDDVSIPYRFNETWLAVLLFLVSSRFNSL